MQLPPTKVKAAFNNHLNIGYLSIINYSLLLKKLQDNFSYTKKIIGEDKMRRETIEFAKKEILRTAILTEDEELLNKLWSCINSHYRNKPEEDPRYNNLGSDFWDSKDTEVNMYNVKIKLMENIEMLPENYPNDLKILHRLYGITKLQLEQVANRKEDEAGILL